MIVFEDFLFVLAPRFYLSSFAAWMPVSEPAGAGAKKSKRPSPGPYTRFLKVFLKKQVRKSLWKEVWARNGTVTSETEPVQTWERKQTFIIAFRYTI
jgi:hypothetical protein